jgi:CHAD domain-containing protein
MAKASAHVHIRPYGAVTENARRIIRARLTEMYAWAQYAHDERRAREQHQMRIAAKRLRYTLELFREYLPERAGECIKDLRSIQDALGLLHDCDVLITILRSALFVPDGRATLVDAIPEACDLPPALLEVLGQRAPGGDLAPTAFNHRAEALNGTGKHDQRHKKDKKDRRKKGKKARAGKHGNERRLIEAARAHLRPTGEQRAGLELLLAAKLHERDQLYQQFVKRWEKLEARQFRATILHLIEGAEPTGHLHLRRGAAPETGKIS